MRGKTYTHSATTRSPPFFTISSHKVLLRDIMEAKSEAPVCLKSHPKGRMVGRGVSDSYCHTLTPMNVDNMTLPLQGTVLPQPLEDRKVAENRNVLAACVFLFSSGSGAIAIAQLQEATVPRCFQQERR